MMINRKYLFALILLASVPSFGAELISPEGSELISTQSNYGNVSFPIGPARNGLINFESFEGNIFTDARKMNGAGVSSLIDEFITSYEAKGFTLEFRCSAKDCGGFDFRYAIETPGPRNFRVNLDNYEYIDMRTDKEVLSLIASELDGTLYIQQTQVILAEPSEFEMETSEIRPTAPSMTERVVLSSITFELGSSEIATFDEVELAAVAARLENDPQLTLYLVGHSDQIGGLSANISISRARAASVRSKLINDFNIPAARVYSEGVAFLAPVADNRTEEGRNMNRRVEAVFLVNN